MSAKTTLLFFVLSLSALASAQFPYPSARKEAFDTTIFGIKLSDPYFWMSRKTNEKEMLAFSSQQGKFAQTILDSIPGLSSLEKEMGEVFDEMQPEIWNMFVANNRFYYYRDIPGQGPTLCRRQSINAEEEKLLTRVRINGQSYAVRKRVFAHSKPLVALMLTQNGEANPQIRIFDLDKKEFLTDSIAPVMFNDSRGVSMAWSADDEQLFYTQAPSTDIHKEKYFRGKIKSHALGSDQSADQVVFGIGVNSQIQLRPEETPYIYSFNHSPYLVARIRSGSGDNYAYAVHYSKLNGANTPWKKLRDYVNLGDGFDANGKWLYAATNGGPRYTVSKIDMETGNKPEIFLPQQEAVLAVTDTRHSSGIVAGRDVLYVLIRKPGNMQVLKIDYASKKSETIPIREKVNISRLMLVNENDLVFVQSSPVKSDMYKLYRHASNKIENFPFADKVLDKSNELKSEVIYIPSRDGKMIPVTFVYPATIKLQGNNPVMIDGYGNSGASEDLGYNPSWTSWLKRGGVYAYAHVRGGGELGEDWYKDGQYPRKMNSVNDVVDVSAWLVKHNYTSPAKLLLMGGSAGTFLVGNAINQRPDLFAGGIYLAGLPDLATHTDAAGGREEKSVGPKNTKEGFKSNYDLSALYHIPQGKELPSMLIVHGASDYILAMHPAARYAATLQDRQQGRRPILFLVSWEGGHLGSDNEIFYIMKYALWQTGHPEFQVKQ